MRCSVPETISRADISQDTIIVLVSTLTSKKTVRRFQFMWMPEKPVLPFFASWSYPSQPDSGIGPEYRIPSHRVTLPV